MFFVMSIEFDVCKVDGSLGGGADGTGGGTNVPSLFVLVVGSFGIGGADTFSNNEEQSII